MLLSEMQDSTDYKLYCDLDGVLADFEAILDRVMSEKYSQHEYETDSKYRTKMWKMIHEYQKAGGELWYELPQLEAGKLWKHIKGHKPEILSATGDPVHKAEKQKHRWVAKHLGSDVTINLTRKAADKAKYADKQHILIDDKQKAIGPWVAAGGIGILHTSASDTIKQLAKYGL